MPFEEFLQQRLTKPLPGVDAHFELVPSSVDARQRLMPAPDDARQSAVLVTLLESQGELPDVLFTLRSENLRTHKSQISFPGGRLDEGEDFTTAALRELHEETGVDASAVRILGHLTPIFIPPSNSQVIPVVGMTLRPDQYTINETEVQEIFDVPLSFFIDVQSLDVEQQVLRGQEVDVPHWRVHPAVRLWGATAMILNELVWIAREFTQQHTET